MEQFSQQFNRDVTFSCEEDEMIVVNGMSQCRIPDGQTVIQNLNFDDGVSILVCVIVLISMICFYRFLAGACLIHKGKKAVDA